MQNSDREKVQGGGLRVLLAERDDEVTRLRRMLQAEVMERRRIEAQQHRLGNQLEKLATRLLVSEERECRRIARDLHDSVASKFEPNLECFSNREKRAGTLGRVGWKDRLKGMRGLKSSSL